MIVLLIKAYPFAAPIMWLWFWSGLFELINPAIRWYSFPLIATMTAVLLWLLWGTIVAIMRMANKES